MPDASKLTKHVQLNLLVRPEDRERLRELSNRTDLSLNDICRQAIRKELDRAERDDDAR